MAAFATRAGVHVAVDALAVGFAVTERLIELALPRPEQPGARRSLWSVEVAVPADAPPAEPPAEPAAGEQAVPVESFADAGARDGAGASVHVDEPWKGYARMNAHEIIDRLTGVSAEEAAVVELYERSHRKRKTVLAAAERRLRRPSRAASPS